MIKLDEKEAYKRGKQEILNDFKKANPYYYQKILECKDFQKIIKKI